MSRTVRFRVEETKGGRLFIQFVGDHKHLPTVSAALRDAGFKDGDIIEMTPPQSAKAADLTNAGTWDSVLEAMRAGPRPMVILSRAPKPFPYPPSFWSRDWGTDYGSIPEPEPDGPYRWWKVLQRCEMRGRVLARNTKEALAEAARQKITTERSITVIPL